MRTRPAGTQLPRTVPGPSRPAGLEVRRAGIRIGRTRVSRPDHRREQLFHFGGWIEPAPPGFFRRCPGDVRFNQAGRAGQPDAGVGIPGRELQLAVRTQGAEIATAEQQLAANTSEVFFQPGRPLEFAVRDGVAYVLGGGSEISATILPESFAAASQPSPSPEGPCRLRLVAAIVGRAGRPADRPRHLLLERRPVRQATWPGQRSQPGCSSIAGATGSRPTPAAGGQRGILTRLALHRAGSPGKPDRRRPLALSGRWHTGTSWIEFTESRARDDL